MGGVYIEELRARRSIAGVPERVAMVGRAPAGPRHSPVEIAGSAAFDAVFGPRPGPLRRAVTAYVDQGGDPLLVVRGDDIGAALDCLVGSEATDLVVGPSLLRGRETAVHGWCLAHRVFLFADSPDGSALPGLAENAAAYCPRLRDADGRRVWTAAAVAGVVRRVDRNRGVWRAPANEALVGLTADPLPPAPLVNPVRTFADGTVRVWGARTASTDPEWRYVNVRRLLLFLERSLDQGTRWAAFEPNDDALWADVRRCVEDFLHGLWGAGAFTGASADEAFFVRCDRTTMSQDDLDHGRLVCLVGVAPTRPAEFVIVRITHVTGAS